MPFQNIGQTRIAGAGIGKNAAHRNWVIQLLKNDFIWQLAWIANGERDARLDGDLNRTIQRVITVGESVVDGFPDQLVRVFGDHGASAFGRYPGLNVAQRPPMPGLHELEDVIAKSLLVLGDDVWYVHKGVQMAAKKETVLRMIAAD